MDQRGLFDWLIFHIQKAGDIFPEDCSIFLKHPDIEELEELIQHALASPDEIRQSRSDPNVLLFYLSRKK